MRTRRNTIRAGNLLEAIGACGLARAAGDRGAGAGAVALLARQVPVAREVVHELAEVRHVREVREDLFARAGDDLRDLDCIHRRELTQAAVRSTRTVAPRPSPRPSSVRCGASGRS